MIPLKDENRSRSFPYVTVLIISVNCAVFLYQYFSGPAAFERFVFSYGFTPANFFNPAFAKAHVHAGIPEFLTIFTSMFMHGGFFHIISNMWVLWIFGDNIEDAMGKFRFAVFYILCGLVAVLSHAFFNQASTVPLVGASGAIAGVMGGYFLLYPNAKVVTLFWFLFFIRVIKVPAFVFLGFWFLFQLFFSPTGGQIAYLAHVGGFLSGLILVSFFSKKKKGFRIIKIR